MALQWADSFSRYGTGSGSTTAMLDGLPYGTIGTGGNSPRGQVTTDPDPDSTQLVFCTGYNGNNWQNDFRISIPTPTAGTVGVALRAWLNRLPTTNSERCNIVSFRTVGNDTLCTFRIEQNGSITASNASTQIANSVVPLVSPRSHNHYEAFYNGTTGEGAIYINGVLKLSVSGGTTGTIALLSHASRSGSTGVSPAVYIKDYVIWDETGSQNNSVLGTVMVGRLNPNEDVTLGGWVPSTGMTGFDLLAKDAPDDATYLSADDSPPSPMQFGFENLPDDVTSVRGLVSVTRMLNTDGGDAKVQTSLSPDGVDWDDGADRPVTTAFTYWYDISELSPDTAAPWTPTEVNNITGEVNRTL